jgi:SAM-dependent methyltransferase
MFLLNKKRIKAFLPRIAKNTIKHLYSRGAYHDKRRNLLYYKAVNDLATRYGRTASSVIDIGCMDARFVNSLNWISSRVALDLHSIPITFRTLNVKRIRTDFLSFETSQKYDLVLCLQVLEHLDDPHAFAHKLLAIGHKVIISVPYKWPQGFCQYHVQDPVDEDKLMSWIQREWIEKVIVTESNGISRIVIVVEGD